MAQILLQTYVIFENTYSQRAVQILEGRVFLALFYPLGEPCYRSYFCSVDQAFFCQLPQVHACLSDVDVYAYLDKVCQHFFYVVETFRGFLSFLDCVHSVSNRGNFDFRPYIGAG
jgi:hypothetical protein